MLCPRRLLILDSSIDSNSGVEIPEINQDNLHIKFPAFNINFSSLNFGPYGVGFKFGYSSKVHDF